MHFTRNSNLKKINKRKGFTSRFEVRVEETELTMINKSPLVCTPVYTARFYAGEALFDVVSKILDSRKFFEAGGASLARFAFDVARLDMFAQLLGTVEFEATVAVEALCKMCFFLLCDLNPF